MKIIIFAGGYGTRMWPASRKSFPKQFYPLIKGRSFFQITVDRFKKKFKVEDIFSEDVQHTESHGIRDKGTVVEHQFLVLS